MNNKINFLSFATTNWKNSIIRISSQLDSIQNEYSFFNKAIFLTENDLKEEYFVRFGNFLSDHGYGYYSWKPLIILESLNDMQENDFLFYMDGGCSFPTTSDKLNSFLYEIDKKCDEMIYGNIDFGCPTTPKHIPVERTIRMEILKYFHLENDFYFRTKYPHFQAGMMLIRKTYKTINIVNEWYRFFIDNYESLIHVKRSDSKGQAENFIHFTGDQAILQCLLYIHDIKVLNCYDPFVTYGVYSRIRN